jgi:hypothetical protein
MTVTRFFSRCGAASWHNTTIYGTYSQAYKKASIISEECFDNGYEPTVDIMKEHGVNLVLVGQAIFKG